MVTSDTWVSVRLGMLLLLGAAGCSGGGSASSGASVGTVTSGGDQSGGTVYSTSNVYCDLSELSYNNDESVNANSDFTWTCNTQNRVLSANGIPNHEVGTFPNANNPNTISVQNIAKTFTVNPSAISTDGVSAGSGLGGIAYAINGIKFDPGTAGRCSDSGVCSLGPGGSGAWNIEALGHETFDFGDDMNHAHVQRTGEYHYHGMPERYLTKLGKGEAMTFVAWALDGFPVYARYGYSTAGDASSVIKILTSSWRLKSSGDIGRPSAKYPDGSPISLGAFTQDYEYIESLGDLDRCNGRVGVTPEFAGEIYYYVITDSFPYAPRCLIGSFTQ